MPSAQKSSSKSATAKARGAKKSVTKPRAKKTVKEHIANKNKKPASPVPGDVYNKLSLLVLSPFRFPVDAEKLAIQSARLAGLAFVFIGAILTIFHVPGMSERLSVSQSATQEASVFDALRGTEFAVVQSSLPTNLPNDLQARRIIDNEILSGYGKPNTPTLVYFFTAPAVASIVTDENGGWTYDVKNISLKSDRVAYVAVTDNAPMPEQKSEKESLEAAVLASNFDLGVMNLLMSMGIVVLGLLLLLLGMHLRSNRREEHTTSPNLSPNQT